MTLSFPLTRNPDVGLNKQVQYRVRKANFDDGYSARMAGGLNNKELSIDLTWSAITNEDADIVEAFFDEHQGVTAFYFTMPGEIVPTKVTCEAWSRSPPSGLLATIKATFTKVNDL